MSTNNITYSQLTQYQHKISISLKIIVYANFLAKLTPCRRFLPVKTQKSIFYREHWLTSLHKLSWNTAGTRTKRESIQYRYKFNPNSFSKNRVTACIEEQVKCIVNIGLNLMTSGYYEAYANKGMDNIERAKSTKLNQYKHTDKASNTFRLLLHTCYFKLYILC